MNFRVTIGLAVFLLALAGAYYALGPGIGQDTRSLAPATTLVDYAQDEISQVVFRAGTETIVLRREAGSAWTYRISGISLDNPADQPRVTGLAGRVAGLTAQSQVVAEPSPEQLTEYGLVQPEIELTVSKGSDVIVLAFGQQNVRSTGYYARRTGRPAVYLVSAFLIDDLKGLISRPPDPPTPTPAPASTGNP